MGVPSDELMMDEALHYLSELKEAGESNTLNMIYALELVFFLSEHESQAVIQQWIKTYPNFHLAKVGVS